MTKVRLAADGSWMGTPMTDKRFLEFEELEKKAEEQQKKESSEQMQNPQPLHSKEHGVGCILAGSLKLNKVNSFSFKSKTRGFTLYTGVPGGRKFSYCAWALKNFTQQARAPIFPRRGFVHLLTGP